MREARTSSLRAYLLLVLIGTTLPVLLIAGLLVSRVVADNRDEVSRRLLEAARAGATVVDAELGGTIRGLQGLSESDRLTNSELPEFQLEARRLLATFERAVRAKAPAIGNLHVGAITKQLRPCRYTTSHRLRQQKQRPVPKLELVRTAGADHTPKNELNYDLRTCS